MVFLYMVLKCDVYSLVFLGLHGYTLASYSFSVYYTVTLLFLSGYTVTNLIINHLQSHFYKNSMVCLLLSL